MAKKKAVKVNATEEPRLAKPVRLDLASADHARLDKLARRRGLSMASLARMVLLKQMAILEKEDAAEDRQS